MNRRSFMLTCIFLGASCSAPRSDTSVDGSVTDAPVAAHDTGADLAIVDAATDATADASPIDGRAADLDAPIADATLPDAETGDASVVVPSAPAEAFAHIRAGLYHTCGLRSTGTIDCWGTNAFGELGDGGAEGHSAAPVRVAGVTDAVAIAAGYDHTCALRTSGAVVCWGQNIFGNIGDGTTVTRPTPVAVSGLTDAVEITAGQYHTCARRSSGGVVCWGANTWGQLGDGTLTSHATPTPVSALPDATEIGAGESHTCARRARTNLVVCWGHNPHGQLGDSSATDRLSPTSTSHYGDMLAVNGNHSCFADDRGVRCWGENTHGQIGDGTTTDRRAATNVVSLAAVTQVAAGKDHACALRTDATVACWGDDDHGQVGDGATTDQLTPVSVAGLRSVVELTAGGWHTCARLASGAVLCWGDNGDGQLGDGTRTERSEPVPVDACDGATMYYADCDADGYGDPTSAPQCGMPPAPPSCVAGLPAATWVTDRTDCDDTNPVARPGGVGACDCGVRGSAVPETCNGVDDDCNTVVDDATPSDAFCSAAPGVVSATCSSGECFSACVSPLLDCDSAAPGCETDPRTDRSRCGDCVHACAWTCASGSCDDPIGIDAGQFSMCAVVGGGGDFCWGSGTGAVLGDGTVMNHPVPNAVPGITDAIAVTAAANHTCAVHRGGTASCWGTNLDSQLGDGTTTLRYSPVDVIGVTDAVQIAAAYTTTCIRRTTGIVSCWGGGGLGQLGDGVASHSSCFGVDCAHAPVDVSGLTDAVRIEAGSGYLCALRSTGSVSCWGANDHGQIGDGTHTNRNVPTAVATLVDAVAVATGGWHACAVRSTGQVVCWGDNRMGALGDGTTTERTMPVTVAGIADAVAVFGGDDHTCAVRAGGTVSCSGRGNYGQLGDGRGSHVGTCRDSTGTLIDCSTSPVTVSGLSGAVALALGGEHSCALDAASAIWCWGYGSSGELGDGRSASSNVPVRVSSP